MFVQPCVYYLSTSRGEKTPPPYCPAFHGMLGDNLLKFVYISISAAASSKQSVIMLCDDHSSHCCFFLFSDASAENATRAIIDGCSAFGVASGLISDGATHFKNDTLRLVAKGLQVSYHFMLAYACWSNGGIARRGKALFRVLPSTASELQLVYVE